MSDGAGTTAISLSGAPGPSGEDEIALPRPDIDPRIDGGSRRLGGKIALVTNGDTRMGRAIAVGLATEGADVALIYRDGHEAVRETMRLIAESGRATMAVSGDIGNSGFCVDAIEQVVGTLGQIDALVITADEASERSAISFPETTDADVEHTFRGNVFGPIFLARATLARMRDRGAIVQMTAAGAGSVQADSARAAVLGMTRSLALAVKPRGIRVNAVVTGACDADRLAPACVFLLSDSGAAFSGETFHPHARSP